MAVVVYVVVGSFINDRVTLVTSVTSAVPLNNTADVEVIGPCIINFLEFVKDDAEPVIVPANISTP